MTVIIAMLAVLVVQGLTVAFQHNACIKDIFSGIIYQNFWRVNSKMSHNIRILRKKAGLTQIDVAKALGVSIATFRRWEFGESAPTGTRIVELAKLLNVEPERLVSESRPVVSSNNVLIFEKGEGYKLFNQLVEKFICSDTTA